MLINTFWDNDLRFAGAASVSGEEVWQLTLMQRLLQVNEQFMSLGMNNTRGMLINRDKLLKRLTVDNCSVIYNSHESSSVHIITSE